MRDAAAEHGPERSRCQSDKIETQKTPTSNGDVSDPHKIPPSFRLADISQMPAFEFESGTPAPGGIQPFCADAAFAMPEIYTFLEAEGFKYTIRLPANTVFQSSALWALPRRSRLRSRSPNWLKQNSG